MREILRLSLILALVGIISAALLTAAYNVTEPIIIERRAADYRQALENFFPGFASFETEQVEEGQFDLIYDDTDDLMGIMATVAVLGYDGDITYNLAFDDSGEIIGINIVSHTETPGIGDVIERGSFQEQFEGKSHEDPITAGEDVEIVTGATVSTVAMINSIRQKADFVAQSFLGIEAEEISFAEVPDGTYQGSAQGFIGPIVVEVEVSGGEVIDIEVLEHEETATYFVESYPLVPERIIEEQSLDIDTQTGATGSAEGIVNAVQNALMEALGIEGDPVEEPVAVDITEVPDGIYQGSADGFMGPIVVEVEVSNGEIIGIEVLEHEDTPEYFRESSPLIPDLIIEEQHFDIDTETGATVSAEGIVNAVLNALSDALDNGGGGDEN